MPDSRHHRGPAPDDPHLFNPQTLPALRHAVADLSLLLTRGYAQPGALKLVGDRYTLTTRQRTAVWRCACTDGALRNRLAHRLPPTHLANQPLLIDGYNVLLTLESALGHATLLRARDTTIRDLAAVHGTYRKVEETRPALELLGQTLATLNPSQVTLLLDAPVSNSARLKQLIQTLADHHHWPWQVELHPAPDKLLIHSPTPIATADSAILDRAHAPWLNLARETIERRLPTAPIFDLSTDRSPD